MVIMLSVADIDLIPLVVGGVLAVSVAGMISIPPA
jgi:hypothetical protein